jgi:hypothetical protein
MNTLRETTQMPKRHSPASKLRTIIDWIVETDRRFRMCQDRIDRFRDKL